MFKVRAGTDWGIPALTEAWRATFCPNPPWSTQPIRTSSTCSGAIFARLNDSLITILPSSAAGTAASFPPIFPTAVRTAPANTIFFAIFIPPNFCTKL